MPKKEAKFKPYCGRCFELKNHSYLKDYPKFALIMDENSENVMSLDFNGVPVRISKYYLKQPPVAFKMFSTSDTVDIAIDLIETLRSKLSSTLSDTKAVSSLNKDCANVMQQLRDLGERTKNAKFAPPEPEENPDIPE
jgi:hypothetical protein